MTMWTIVAIVVVALFALVLVALEVRSWHERRSSAADPRRSNDLVDESVIESRAASARNYPI